MRTLRQFNRFKGSGPEGAMSQYSFSTTRRRFLQSLSAAATSAGLSGCHRVAYPVLVAGTLAPQQKVAATDPLTIDTHCHIFNGTDIQLTMFLEKVEKGFSQRVVELAQKLESSVGVQGDAEWKELIRLASWSKCSIVEITDVNSNVGTEAVPLGPESSQPEKARDHVKGMRDEAFRKTKKGLLVAMLANPKHEDQHTDNELTQILDVEDHQSFRKKVEAKKVEHSAQCGDGTSLAADLETVVDYFLPRIVLAQLYLDTFCPAAGRNVDLMFCPMVDYDWWLAKGSNPETPLKQQTKLMEQVSILSGGRIHGFAPFCPLREVAFRAGYGNAETGWSSLEFVKDAVLNRGCVGVKLYPPMGFAPYGNAELDDPMSPKFDGLELRKCDDYTVYPHQDFWTRNTLLPDWAREKAIRYEKDGSEERLGTRLDGALASLYEWCQSEDVPILAHTNASNGVDWAYEKLATAEHWCKALTLYPKLRVSFGHLGGFDDKLGSPIRVPPTSQAFIDLMGNTPNPLSSTSMTYSHTYADSAYDAVLLSCRDKFTQRVELAYKEPSFSDRFLYGTDWSLMVHVGHNKLYLKEYEALMYSVDASYSGAGRKPSERFFGWNAVDYAGLRIGDKSRQRLDTFYLKYRVQKPGWADKVDLA
jgi:hypothetical protein